MGIMAAINEQTKHRKDRNFLFFPSLRNATYVYDNKYKSHIQNKTCNTNRGKGHQTTSYCIRIKHKNFMKDTAETTKRKRVLLKITTKQIMIFA